LQNELEDKNKLRSFWRNNAFIIESHTKYGEQKIFKYFVPSLLIPLLNLGLSPLDPLCTYFLKELKKEFCKGGWPTDFRSSDICTFTTALALQTLYTLASRISVIEMQKLISENEEMGINNINRDKKTDLNGYKEKYEKLKQRVYALVFFFSAFVFLLNVPWQNLISFNKPYFMVAATVNVALLIYAIIFFFRYNNPELQKMIVEIVALLGSIAALIIIMVS